MFLGDKGTVDRQISYSYVFSLSTRVPMHLLYSESVALVLFVYRTVLKKYLNIIGFPGKLSNIKFALNSAGKWRLGIEKDLNFSILVGLNTCYGV